MLSSEHIRPLLAAEVVADGVPTPVYVHVVEHPQGLVLVDTGMPDAHPEIAEWQPRPRPLPVDPTDIAVVVNTHLHFDHCGGNRLFPGRPIHVQRRELEDARADPDYTIPEWVDFPGVVYEPVEGEVELLPGIRLVPAPGHTAGHQVVVVEVEDGLVVIGGDVAYTFRELTAATTEGQRRVLGLEPRLVWLAHRPEPWRPELS